MRSKLAESIGPTEPIQQVSEHDVFIPGGVRPIPRLLFELPMRKGRFRLVMEAL